VSLAGSVRPLLPFSIEIAGTCVDLRKDRVSVGRVHPEEHLKVRATWRDLGVRGKAGDHLLRPRRQVAAPRIPTGVEVDPAQSGSSIESGKNDPDSP
jgi:hypothetical protein